MFVTKRLEMGLTLEPLSQIRARLARQNKEKADPCTSAVDVVIACPPKISAMVGIKPLFVMRGFFDDFLLMTIFFLTLTLIADESFYSVV
ncbi:hypothetical protein BTM315_04290 [Helicobacter pylori]